MGGVSSASSGGAFSRSGSRGSEDGGKLNRPQPSSTALVQLLMPTYYDSDMMTHEQLVQASNSWALIVKDEVPRFLAQQKASSVFAAKYPTAMNQFTDVFLKRLCYLQPTTKILLVPIENKEKFVSQIVNFMLSEVEEQPTFVILAEHLAESHHSRGVRAADYGMLGEALLFALREVLGVEYPHAWVNVYSRVLRTVIPKAVELELATPTDKVRQSLQYAYFIQMNNGSGSEKIIEPAPHRVSSLPKLDSPSIDTCEI